MMISTLMSTEVGVVPEVKDVVVMEEAVVVVAAALETLKTVDLVVITEMVLEMVVVAAAVAVLVSIIEVEEDNKEVVVRLNR